MLAFPLRGARKPSSAKTAKLLCSSVFTAAILLASSSPSYASTATQAAATVKSVTEQVSGAQSLIERWTPFIKEASRRFGVAEDWIKAVMRVESGGRSHANNGKPIISKAGAIGLMQVMPETYADMRQQYGLGSDPADPHDNVLAGTAYLQWLYKKYGFPKMFAAYNAGPGTVEKQMSGAGKLPAETRAYVKNIAQILGPGADASASAKATRSPVVAAAIAPTPVTLTRPDGSPISVDAVAVDSIRASLPNEYAPGVQTVLAMGKLRQGVTEDPATVAAMLKKHGGKDLSENLA